MQCQMIFIFLPSLQLQMPLFVKCSNQNHKQGSYLFHSEFTFPKANHTSNKVISDYWLIVEYI